MNQIDDPPQEPINSSLARSASLLSIGNMISRVLGVVREMVIASFFGASELLDAFNLARQVPLLVYDFLVGGILSAALVPSLSEYATAGRRAEFIRLAGTLVSIFVLLLSVLLVLLELAVPSIARLLIANSDQVDPTLFPITTNLMRITMISVWLSGMAGIFMAILYALQRFLFPAIATAIYNLGIVLAAVLLADQIGVTSLALGLLIGSLTQLLLMALDLRRWLRITPNETAARWFPLRIDWQHPALCKIVRLYVPIAAGMGVSIFQVGLDRRLATGTGTGSISWMQFATTLQQMPLGLISIAIALAALPQLSQYFGANDEAAYRATLLRGLRMVLLLIVPAAVALWLLGEPITRLLFERNKFTPQDTEQVVLALSVYVVGMLFAAVDFPLNYAMYARSNTLIPALVGVVSVLVYVVVAFALLDRLGFLGLVWADSAKHASHALIMMGVLQQRVGGLLRPLLRSTMRILPAALAMAGLILGLQWQWSKWFTQTLSGDFVQIVVLGACGLLVYVAVLAALRMDELALIWRQIASRARAR